MYVNEKKAKKRYVFYFILMLVPVTVNIEDNEGK